MTDLQKAAEKYRVENPFNTGTSGIDLSYLRKADFLAGFEYRDAEVERLRSFLAAIQSGMRGSSVMTRAQMIETARKALESESK